MYCNKFNQKVSNELNPNIAIERGHQHKTRVKEKYKDTQQNQNRPQYQMRISPAP